MIAKDAVSNYLESLASNASTPGGGAAAGMTGAQAAALISMVCRLSRKHTEVTEEILAVADVARGRFIQLVDADTQCFDEVMQAYKMKPQTDEEKAHRNHRLQQALKDAARVPLEMIDEAGKLIPLAGQLVEVGNRNLITDTGIAASLLECVISSSRFNVMINLNAIDDEDFVGSFEAKLVSATEMIEQAHDIYHQVEAILQQS